MYKVSVLVPVYNVAPYIERCVRSIFEQSYENLECVFVDDCSPDNSIQILQNLLKEYPSHAQKIRIIRNTQNKGIAAIRNMLLENATGEFLFYVDSDDWIETNAIDLLVRKQRETDADIITGRTLEHSEMKVGDYEVGSCLNRERLLEEVLSLTCSTHIIGRLIRRALFFDYGLHFLEGVDYSEDYQVLPLLVYYAQKVAGISEVVYHYNRMLTTSYTNTLLNNTNSQLNHISSRKFVTSFFSDKSSYFCKLSEYATTDTIHSLLIRNYQSKNKQGHFLMVNELNLTPEYTWKRIKWNYWIIRKLEGNYHTVCIVCFFRRLWALLLKLLDMNTNKYADQPDFLRKLSIKAGKISWLKGLLRPIYSRYLLSMKNHNTEIFLNNYLSVLKSFDLCMEDNGFFYTLAFGTMLGAVREHDIIQHDHDLDVAMWAEDYSPKLRKCLEKEGFRQLRELTVQEGRLGREETYEKNGVHIDIFFIYPAIDKYPYCCDFVRESGSVSLKDSMVKFGYIIPRRLQLPWIKKVKRIPFVDTTLPIPVNATEILTFRYGADYMTPNPQWNYTDANENVVEWKEEKGVLII